MTRQPRSDDSESAVQREVRLALSGIGCVVWRNNVGVDAARGVRYGLQVGSGDLIGIAPGGRFLSVECKRRTGGRVSDQQRLWLELVRARGGIAIVARSGDEAVTLVQAALRGEAPVYCGCGVELSASEPGQCLACRTRRALERLAPTLDAMAKPEPLTTLTGGGVPRLARKKSTAKNG